MFLFKLRHYGKQWRLIFRWNGGRGEATGVYLDGHRYL